MNKEKSVIAQALGRLGGKKTKEKYGSDHFKELSRKAAEARKEKKAMKYEEKDL